MIHQLHEVWCLSPPSSLTLTASAASASPTPADAVARSEACSGHLSIVTGRACDVRSTSKQSADSRYAETQAASCHRSLPTRACSIALWHVGSPLQTTVHEYFAYAQYHVYRDLSRWFAGTHTHETTVSKPLLSEDSTAHDQVGKLIQLLPRAVDAGSTDQPSAPARSATICNTSRSRYADRGDAATRRP